MNRMNRKRNVKGFTLMELIIVIAIIGILLGILAPTMMTYYRKSRIKSANAEAKMVYNAAQTASQSIIAMDRGRTTKSEAGSFLIVSYADGATRYSTAYSSWGAMTALPANVADYTEVDRDVQRIASTVNRTVSDSSNKCWTVVINNYIVRAAIAAESQNTRNVGYYSSNRAQANDATTHSYSEWLNTTGASPAVDNLQEAVALYDVVAATEAATEASTT